MREDAGEDRELAGEVGRAGDGERQHADDHHDRGEDRPALRHPAELGELIRAGALDHHAGEQEHRGRDEAVADGVEHRAVEPEVVGREDPEHDQPHLRHRRVGDDAADVRLAEREQRAVDEAERREHEDRCCASRRPAPGSAAARSR